MAPHVYLVKDGNDLVCHCHCEPALVTFPPQLSCPWCGCGWLFACIECRKAFTFARGIQVDESWEELAVRDLTNKWHKKPSKRDVKSWMAAMKELLADVEVDRRYVCFDGAIIPVDAGGLVFDGWHSHHDLEYVPQVAALQDPSIVQQVLSNRGYWQATALSEE
ncbi:MAG: hypothetical protein ACRELG_10570 [Gemmataceae bacterium]